MGARSDNGVTGRARVVEKSRDGTAAQKTTVSDDTLPPGGASRHDWPVPCCRIVLNITLTAGGTPRQRRMERRPPAAWQCGMEGGRGAEEKVRGAEPSGGFAARRRKRAGRGYMLPFARVEHGLPLRQRTLPPMPEQRNTSRTKPSTLYYNRAFQEVLLRIRGSKSGMPFPVFAKAAEYVYPVSRPPSPVNPAGG